VDVEPLEVSSVALHAGERYDFQFCATGSRRWSFQSKEFKIIAEAPELCDGAYLKRSGQPAPETCRFQAMLRYKALIHHRGRKFPQNDPGARVLDLGSWGSYETVKPLEVPPKLKSQPDISVKLQLGTLEDGRMYLHNSRTPWKNPTSPLLMTKGLACADGVPMINVPETATDVELVVQSELDDLQVVHLHGTKFQVLSVVERGSTPKESPAPLLRDTVAVPGKGEVVLRLLATSPGFWALHALPANARRRGAATVLNVLPSQQQPAPGYVPTTLCSLAEISV